MSSPATRRRRRPPPPPPAWTPEPWSDGETSALLEAWGPRHLRAGGGPLLTADWRACAAAVAARRAAAGRAPRTVDQCKNRMDYLKKRLKALRLGPSPPPPLSGYLRRLRKLLRQAPSVPFGVSHRRHAPSVPFGVSHRRRAANSNPKPKPEDDDYDYYDGDDPVRGAPLHRDLPPVPKRRRTAVALSPVSPSVAHSHVNGGAGCTEVAAALDRLAGTYERVEAAKQREAARLEERRLEAIRDLEIERLRVLVDVAVPAPADAETPSAAPAPTPAAASPAAA